MVILSYEAVTFDFWNTLIPETTETRNRRRENWARLLLDAGFGVTSERLDEAFNYGWEEFDKRWRSNCQTSVVEVTAAVINRLGLSLNTQLRGQLTAAYLEASENTPRTLLPQVEETLDRLSEMGIHLGLICDVGTVPSITLQDWMRELRVHHYFKHFSFSDEVGVYKPHPGIFQHALCGLGIRDPAQAAHIGDLKRTDVVGARTVGMTSVRYAGGRVDDGDGDEADHVINQHLALFDVLKL